MPHKTWHENKLNVAEKFHIVAGGPFHSFWSVTASRRFSCPIHIHVPLAAAESQQYICSALSALPIASAEADVRRHFENYFHY